MISRLEKASALDALSDRIQGAVQSATPRRLRDVLHGTWVGHPLHPVLVQVPVGAFISASVLDALPGQSKAATTLIRVGVAGAVPAIAAGWVDWSSLSKDQRRVGLVHAAGNAVAVGLYVGSLAARSSGRWGLGRFLAYAGLSVAGGGAYLGGHLSYEQGAGVNMASADVLKLPEDWAEVGLVTSLPEGKPTVRTVGDVRVLLYRQGEDVTAMIEQCGHQGAPLGEGDVEGTGADACVVCPWHGSTFRLVDGVVRHGPAAGDQPTLRTRIRDGVLSVATP
ncbi:Rieske 2Fe-2S domain-containing protein [Actinoplanes sp. N902-109]|uniref:Rieske 2Fe-2S domain-containing protein n=1 Tax=Actinoplanes sp. (strain N902-109) TaxID=649831 RepID=UPI001E2E234C|nr:Rieske 2Fe-2S domain-containing protein [Actinoplanes sp. N902-109]